jgi:drug/metabolite transporter (DMT)-like permease
MDTATVKHKRRKLAISLALVGLLIAAVFFAYFETDPRPGSPTALLAGGLALVLCPGSLLFVTWIDIEPQTSAFAVMWLIIGLINFALYGGIGLLVSRFKWKASSPEASERPIAGS